MSILGTAYVNLGWRPDSTFTDIAIGSAVPSGAQLALIFCRHDNAEITSFTATFGTASVISQVTSGGPRSSIVAVVVSSTGAGHAVSVQYAWTGNGLRRLAIVYLDEIDTSAQANWLRDFSTVQSTSVTVDSEPSDLVIAAHGCWGSGPPSQPAGTTTIIAPIGDDENDQRVVSIDSPGTPTTTTTSSGSNASAAAVSIIFTAGTTQVAADVELRWDALVTVASGLGIQWQLLARIASDVSLQWATVVRIAQSLDVQWSSLGLVDVGVDLRWRVLSAVLQELSLRWGVRGLIASALDIRWEVVERTQNELTLRWRVESDDQFPDITGVLTVASSTPRRVVMSATPRITIH